MSSGVEKLLKPREFCEIVRISYSTLKQWVREGRVRVLRTSTGRWRIPYSEVERVLGLRPEGKEDSKSS